MTVIKPFLQQYRSGLLKNIQVNIETEYNNVSQASLK